MSRMRSLIVAIFVALGVAGCSVLEQQQSAVVAPQSVAQTAAYAYAQLAASYGLLADMVERKRIAGADARKVLGQLDSLRMTLDAASASGDANGVQSITQGLMAIEQTLKARSGS